MLYFVKVNENNDVVAYCSSKSDQTIVGWEKIDILPFDISARMGEYKFADGRLLSKVECEGIELKQENEKLKQNVAMLEETILELADIVLN